jgi:glutamate-ammonia-ligase adenylyltransferase
VTGRSLSGEQFFLRLTRQVIRSLSEITEDGFCFRVDTRLRPFGESGPLVCSFGAMEQYYQREGRDWERYALVKARPVAGDIEAGRTLLSILQPFVYRRYIDFGAVEALQEMHAAVRQDAADRGREHDIKRGPGGIREIEFMVQAYQLLRGGREPRLQTPSLFSALSALDEMGMVDSDTVGTLRDHYGFLRRLENCIQALHDQQTHLLPQGDDLGRVATAMGFTEQAALVDAVQQVRDDVNGLFRLHLQPDQPSEQTGHWQDQWRRMTSSEEGPDTDLDPIMARFLERLGRQSMSQRAAQRLGRFMPQLLEQLDGRNLADAVLADVLELVLSITRRSAYLSLLVHNPPACKRMLDLFEESDWVSATVIRHPALLDELLDPTLGRLLPDRGEMDQTTRRIRRTHADIEAVLQALNHFKQAASLRVAVAEIETSLSAEEVQYTLTSLAEAILAVCLELADTEVRSRYESLPAPNLCVIGYGSLGASELSYGSDLDLIFLFESETDASSSLPTERFYTRVARRLISLLTTPTASGRLYETDTRLRPNGRAGLLVSSIRAFEKYQHEKAWTWELQSLTRARALVGDAAIEERFATIRRDVLTRPRDSLALRQDVASMRSRMRSEFSGGDGFKHGAGGLVDIDFLAQLGILECAPTSPEVLAATSTRDQLQALSACGWMDSTQADELCATREALCHARHFASIARTPDRQHPETQVVERICRGILGQHAETWFSEDSAAEANLGHTPQDGLSG